VGDNESEQAEEEDEDDEDVIIEDEDFNQFGIPTGEDVLKQFYSHTSGHDYSLTKRSDATKTNTNRGRGTDEIFRPITPSLKTSFNTRKQTPLGKGDSL